MRGARKLSFVETRALPLHDDALAPSFWLEGPRPAPRAALAGDVSVDVAIVGGGFTGLWTAIALAESDPSVSVAVLEGAVVGYGASGRCGGFAMTLVDRSLTDLVRRVGRDEALAIHTALAERVTTLAPFLDAHGIDCDAMPNGLLVVSSGPEQDRRIETELATIAKLGIGGVRFLDRAAVQEEIHSDRLRCGFEDPVCTLVDPAKLARGLARLAESLGVRIFERSAVRAIDETPGGVRLRTAAGGVSAKRAVLGLNAFGFALPELRRYLMTFYSYILLTEPLGERWERIGWRRRQGVEDKRTFLHYPRPTADGRIAWGGWKTPLRPGGPDPRHDRDEHVFANLERTFRATFPRLDDVRFTHRWGGPLAITGRFMPAAGWLSPGRVAFGFGYNGHGVGPSRLVGEIVRDLLLERRSAITELAFVRKKPSRLPGGALRDLFVTTAIEALLRADDAGKPEPLPFRVLDRLVG